MFKGRQPLTYDSGKMIPNRQAAEKKNNLTTAQYRNSCTLNFRMAAAPGQPALG